MVVSGMPNKQISGQLGTSENTVKVHRSRVSESKRCRISASSDQQANSCGTGNRGKHSKGSAQPGDGKDASRISCSFDKNGAKAPTALGKSFVNQSLRACSLLTTSKYECSIDFLSGQG
jgi:hypothetical protein